MGFSNFKTSGDYIKIENVTYNKTDNSVFVRMGYYSSRGGSFIFPIDFGIDRITAVKNYISDESAKVSEPEYPDVCSDREAMVPMWSEDSTESEKTAYATLKAEYDAAKSAYDDQINGIKATAETSNDFDTHFSKTALYETGNIEKCIYTWAKTLTVFNGVVDVLEDA